MAVEDFAVAIGDLDQPHRAAAFCAANWRLGWCFGKFLPGQQIAPAQVEPHKHLHPAELELGVLAGKAIVAQLLKIRRQDVLQKSAHEFLTGHRAADRAANRSE